MENYFYKITNTINGKVYPSIVICAKELGIHTKTVGYRLKNPRMETWRYIL